MTQYEAAQRGWLLGWTIYGPNTRDFPGFYVARAWVAMRPGSYSRVWPFIEIDTDGTSRAFVGGLCGTLLAARRCVPPEFTCIGRQPNDVPQIIESWV